MITTLSAIKRIENRAKAIPGAISLAQGIPNFASHSLIQEGVIEAIKQNKVDRYSPVAGMPELRTVISENLLQRNMQYDPDTEVIVTAGGIEALSATLLTLLEAGDEVLYLSPAYPYYERIIRMAKGEPVAVHLDEEKGWKPNLNELKKKITSKTRVIILCNPNNPTGSMLSRKELMTIGELAERQNIHIISDDIYEDFYYGGEPPFNLCSEPRFRKQIIRIVSFSKNFALSGWRIGFLHADREHIEKILPIHDNLIMCAPVASQYAALMALKNTGAILSERLELYKKRRELMGNHLEALRDYLSFSWPEGAYYFFPKINQAPDTETLCFDILEKAKVATVPGADFGVGGRGHIRLCFGKSEKEVAEGMERFAHYFRSQHPGSIRT